MPGMPPGYLHSPGLDRRQLLLRDLDGLSRWVRDRAVWRWRHISESGLGRSFPFCGRANKANVTTRTVAAAPATQLERLGEAARGPAERPDRIADH